MFFTIDRVVDAADMRIGIAEGGGWSGLLIKCAGADIEAWILVEAAGSVESILEGIKSDRVGRTSGFIKTQEKASGIMFL